MKPLNIVFAGTPDFAAQHLQALLNSPHRVIAVYTQPDRPAGRGKRLTPSPVKLLAQANDIPVYQPVSLRQAAAQAELAELQPDLMVVVAYGLILPQAALDIPRLGCVNVHGSLLPRWRGAAPLQRAIWAGDTHTGVTIMQMDAGLDTGPMLAKVSYALAPDETSASLYERLAVLAPPALLSVCDRLAQGSVHAEPQHDALATHAAKLSKAEAQLDWTQDAAHLERCIRAFNPWPMSWFSLPSGQNIKVWRATVESNHIQATPGQILCADKHGIVIACGQDSLRLTQLQYPNKKPLAVEVLFPAYQGDFAVNTVLPLLTEQKDNV